MPTPVKTIMTMNCHLTKAEKEARRSAEKSVLTGDGMREYPETKAKPGAHRYFLRVRKLMGLIGRNDAIHEAVINRYAVMLDEADGVAAELRRFDAKLLDAETSELYEKLMGEKLRLEAALDKKRSMLLAIEKENLLTVASGLRAIPKQPPKEEADPMDELLARRMEKAGNG